MRNLIETFNQEEHQQQMYEKHIPQSIKDEIEADRLWHIDFYIWLWTVVHVILIFVNLVVYSDEDKSNETIAISVSLFQLVGVILYRTFVSRKILYPTIAVFLVYSCISIFTFPAST